MKNFFYGIVIGACLIGVWSCAGESSDRVCFGRQCVAVEVVQSPKARARGLQFRESLKRGHGMLFIFPKSGVYPFWMKDTLIPLDMIWMDRSQKVVHIAEYVPPCRQDPCPRYSPFSEAMYVLEVNAGEAKEFGIEKGNQARIMLK